MEFGPVPLDRAEGAILAHSVRLDGGVIRKGVTLGPAEIERLRAHGVPSVVAVRLQPGDVPEDEAAGRLARVVAGRQVRVERPFTGRSNLFADAAGVLTIRRDLIDAINGVDEAITLATLPEWRAVTAGEMIGTVKIIPFALPAAVLTRAIAAAGGQGAAMSVAPFKPMKVAVASTVLPGLKPSVIRKTVDVLRDRLAPAGAGVVAQIETPHETQALAGALSALAAGPAELLIVFGASAITDRHDVVPAAIERVGGRVEHFGMPVDPGNLMLVGDIAGKPVLGAPGCARSPRENGFDWILQRLLAGLAVTRADIVALGVGGLLMEIVQRGQPREGGPPVEDEA